jgi:outer membrane protein insertion porin family
MFNDRFKLGGPMNVRSFKFHSLGPRDEGENLFPGQRQTTILKLRREGDAVGGDAYWAAGISLIGDIPQKSHWPLKPHAYINAGKLAALDRSESLMLFVIAYSANESGFTLLSTAAVRVFTISGEQSIRFSRDRFDL